MVIIQSFAQFDDGSVYVNGKLGGTEIYLNFYTFLLSYLTLKKYYGSVTMYCNKKAYETFIKYIPYDKIIIKENKYSKLFWSAYKLDAIADMKETFIHVDSDVFIFDDLFRPFIDNPDKYDIIVQDVLSSKKLFEFVKPVSYILQNMNFYNENNILSKNIYDSNGYSSKLKTGIRSFSCGVVGMNMKVKNIYIKNTTKIYDKMNIEKDNDDGFVAMSLEEITLYLTAINNNFTYYDILPDEEKIDDTKSAQKYTHMWYNTKFILDNILLIKNKIKKDFNEYYNLVEEYEKTIANKEILIYKKGNENLNIIKYKI